MNDELFYEKATEIDRAIKAGSESLSYASDLLSLLEDPPVRDYFFNHLRSPEWLLPWLQVQTHLLGRIPNKFGLLIKHLAPGEQRHTALDLTKIALAIFPDPKQEEKRARPYRGLDPVARMSTWDYEDVIKHSVPPV